MTITELGAIGELVGGVAVIGSLIFVGMQIRSTAKSVQVSSTLDVMQTWADANNDLCRDSNLSEIYQSAISAEHPILEELDGRLGFFLRSLIHRLEAEHYLYVSGLVPPEVWKNHCGYFHNVIRTPTGGAWWEREKTETIFTTAFIRELESGA